MGSKNNALGDNFAVVRGWKFEHWSTAVALAGGACVVSLLREHKWPIAADILVVRDNLNATPNTGEGSRGAQPVADVTKCCTLNRFRDGRARVPWTVPGTSERIRVYQRNIAIFIAIRDGAHRVVAAIRD